MSIEDIQTESLKAKRLKVSAPAQDRGHCVSRPPLVW